MQNLQDLSGRRAIVTGGAQGLGYCIACALSDAGARLTIIDVEPGLAKASLPPGWDTIALDLARADSLDQQRRLAKKLGTVDIVVANAGIVPPWRGVADLDGAEWAQVMAVNAWGVAATLGGFATALARSAHASAVVMASINGYRAHPMQTLYTASKHAVVGIVRAAALDMGRQGVRVNALAPGPVATPALQERIRQRHAQGGPEPGVALDALNADTALGQIVTPQQIANAALWLASDASAGTTGVVLPVEAGLG